MRQLPLSVHSMRHAISPRRDRGVTLIEMMVAILVLSVGLLGMAGLQAATSKYKINTWARAASSTLLSDLTEKVRINSSMAGPGFLDPLIEGQTATQLTFGIDDDWDAQKAEDFAITKSCATQACSESERADYDLMTWRRSVRDMLPQGSAMISGDKAQGLTVTLMWFDKEQADVPKDATDSIRTLTTAPVCSGNTKAGMAQQSCCPQDANAPAGVKCARFLVVP